MSFITSSNSYTQANGTASTDPFVPVYSLVAPSPTNTGYPIGKRWINMADNEEYTLTSESASAGTLTATWTISASPIGLISTITGDTGGALSPTAGNINILGTALEIETSGSGSTLTIGIPATFSIGSTAGAAGGTISVGTGDFLLQGAASSDITIGTGITTGNFALAAAQTSGTLTLGGTGAATGQMDIAPGTGAQTVTFANNTGVKTIAIGDGVSGNGISIGSGNNTSAQAVNIANGASGADSTVNFFNTASTAGVQTFNLFGANATREGIVNIATGAAAHVVTLGSLTGAAQLVLQSGTAGISLATGVTTPGAISITPAIETTASTPATLDARVGTVVFTGFTTASAAVQIFVINNSVITGSSSQRIEVTAANLGSNDAQMTITRVNPVVGGVEVTLTNNGAAALNGDVQINFHVCN